MTDEDTVMPGPVTDPRAHALRERYHELFEAEHLPVPVESIAEDMLGLSIRESYELGCSGMLIPAAREIWVNAAEHERHGRPRFTLAHEVGHWICHWLEGRTQRPLYCRREEVGPGEGRDLEREANVFAAELLMPEPAVRAEFARRPDLAARFAVSPQAMAWRLYNLGLGVAPTLRR